MPNESFHDALRQFADGVVGVSRIEFYSDGNWQAPFAVPVTEIATNSSKVPST